MLKIHLYQSLYQINHVLQAMLKGMKKMDLRDTRINQTQKLHQFWNDQTGNILK